MPTAKRASAQKKPAATTRRTYVLDTSVLLADPAALRRFEEHEVVLPVVVITELEGKRHHPELGYFARNALRSLDELRLEHGRLDRKRVCRTFSYCTALMRAKAHPLGQYPTGCPPFDKDAYGDIWKEAQQLNVKKAPPASE